MNPDTKRGRKPLLNVDICNLKLFYSEQRPVKCDCGTHFHYVYVLVKGTYFKVGYYCVGCGALHKLKEETPKTVSKYEPSRKFKTNCFKFLVSETF